MAKDTSINKVLVIGSGPIIIGQAAEFDYAGTQACKSLKEEGIEVVLVNSNPATIMTDKNIADHVYIEPLNTKSLEKIIEIERPQGILPTLGGQTGLNLAIELFEQGILDKYNVKLLGTSVEAVKRAEDRKLFKETMESIGQPIPPSRIVSTMDEGISFAREVGYPLIIRPAYTLGGTGGGFVDNEEELNIVLEKGLRLSMIGQALIERSVLNWKEIEYEVMRDKNDNCITICNMENFDPVGVHTGDSIVVAPSQTLRDVEHQMLRSASIDIIRELKIEGGCNIQFALNPFSMEYIVIEVNPRVSRSSALASKATGYPIAKIAAKIAIGLTLDEIVNPVTGKTSALFEPSLDYIVVKIPQWPFDKFYTADRKLGTQMKATGEVMAIDRVFEGALLKAVRSLEGVNKTALFRDVDDIENKLKIPNDQRLFAIFNALRKGYSIDEIHDMTRIDKWFLSKIENIVNMEQELRENRLDINTISNCKKLGFSDVYISNILGITPDEVLDFRKEIDLKPVYKLVDTCAGEFESSTPYFYSTYEEDCEVEVTEKNKVVILGSGPIRIGQGIEFDYCSVHGAWALKNIGVETIIINNNPETVSTDFDTSDKLYFEPLTSEDVINIVEKEKANGVIVQFGGQTAINLVKPLYEKGINILGTAPEDIDKAEDRKKFSELLNSLNIPQTKGSTIKGITEAKEVSKVLGFPLVVRPSYVIGGQSMEIVWNEEQLVNYVENFQIFGDDYPILVDQYIEGKEVEIDGISDGKDVFIPAIMEHIERAGVHSGDSMSVYPIQDVTDSIKEKIVDYTIKIARALDIKGLINIQFVVKGEDVLVLEANPRASRTVPIVSKVTGVPMVAVATEIMLGKTLLELGYNTGVANYPPYVIVKAPVFCLEKLADVDIVLSPEMKSTGEVMGVGENYSEAMLKAFEGVGLKIPSSGGVLLSISDRDKHESLQIAKKIIELGFKIIATEKTANFYSENNIPITKVLSSEDDLGKIFKEYSIVMTINTPTKGKYSDRYGFKLRRKSVDYNIPCFTSIDTALQYVSCIEYLKNYNYKVKKIF
ncbi:carbamoyl-phosphate synthase (glutamine-hydrolyzing) large subunit [Serpentinicella alkaliphila]|uniref:Carbamoyl phosphate synthase large chain n=1 Tax=Serpentinicella alkaliphila TaxID=1734049 RepID=A0A4R2THE1_9FIRM|nr:carbamoyl-phosphate synthase (glutamine-hydrolyzing) large subunit [Serpentinicella alkaliphila]QUH24612.1 carbamoyl-phosphate synthase (glutamine-hydrolyzing) large subunit [Serpentinicella alkaliphila]TCQ02611.1 carbamoyl-phosphate synthase large subunit [Serpentinicella alkaliphila]